ncbi:DNA-binding protein [Lactobacillus bombicola]|uniref:DNA-binding protein n=1 Tax=Lactobacillus bombicola TaxID=1505723 RepID=A0A396SR11_9LACO|nr:DNA-binding protein [Lactobacillus bombicola]RHW54438.1 DNA-binding protein [Lactobacillus bombicola]
MTEYLSYKQAMKYIGCNSYKTLGKLINESLPIIQVGKTKKISKSAIDEFMKEHQKVINK